MNTGLQDAANLGWKLAAAAQGWAPDGLLDTYQSERHPVGHLVLRSSGAIIRMAMIAPGRPAPCGATGPRHRRAAWARARAGLATHRHPGVLAGDVDRGQAEHELPDLGVGQAAEPALHVDEVVADNDRAGRPR
jgi:2-polyprenyl-6-methoxyphenol hydroxylase-like FAD-dependent oxidoreductase